MFENPVRQQRTNLCRVCVSRWLKVLLKVTISLITAIPIQLRKAFMVFCDIKIKFFHFTPINLYTITYIPYYLAWKGLQFLLQSSNPTLCLHKTYHNWFLPIQQKQC